MVLSNVVEEDLARSGLTTVDISAREASAPEFAAVGIPANSSGYVIPYFDISGKSRSFYRVKLFGHMVKYKQPKQTSNHVYFPKNLQKAIAHNKQNSPHNYVIICEGEKKAAACVKDNIPAIGLGGVDSWKNRTLVIPADSDLGKSYGKDQVNVKLPSGQDDVPEQGLTILANGMMELIDMAIEKDLHIIIAFDSDEDMGTKYEVQRAASALGFELRYRGVPFKNIHQLVLPPTNTEGKVGIDDFIQSEGIGKLHELSLRSIDRGSFPRHPNIREFVSRKLQRATLSRKETQHVSLAILSDLDATGKRLQNKAEKESYYFDSKYRQLIPVNFNAGAQRGVSHSSPFGQLLYRRYGLSANDTRVLAWLDAQFHGELPLEDVLPHRVIATPMQTGEDCIRYQINDGQYVKITSNPDEPVEVFDNGDNGILFEADQVQPISSAELLEAVEVLQERRRNGEKMFWWKDVLDKVRLEKDEQNKILIALLYYISPWLYKWRGTQLPIELVLGESGSGKSSLCEHRLNVLTGDAKLRNAPSKIDNWYASVGSTGGVHAVDNVQLMDKNLRQKLSDEMCRLVTEPNPSIEMRKLYSNNVLIRVPTRVVFCITAIQQPFNQADFMQRSVVIKLDKNGSAKDGYINYHAEWVPEQMRAFGGRAMWLAHQMLVMHDFFKKVEESWNPDYRASHRLINVEQSLKLCAEVLGLESSWIPSYFAQSTAANISTADWALEGLQAFAELVILNNATNKTFSASHIAEWASKDEDFMDCIQLTNPRKLGRYLKTSAQMIRELASIVEAGKLNNKAVYQVITK